MLWIIHESPNETIMKFRSLVFQLDTTPYPARVLVSVCQTDERFKQSLSDYLGADKLAKPKYKGVEKSSDDVAAYILNMDEGDMVIRLYSKPRSPEDYALIQHEIYHIIHGIMRHCNIKPTKGNEEAYAYLTQHLTEQLYRKLMPKK